jgi:hypothetical protein
VPHAGPARAGEALASLEHQLEERTAEGSKRTLGASVAIARDVFSRRRERTKAQGYMRGRPGSVRIGHRFRLAARGTPRSPLP